MKYLSATPVHCLSIFGKKNKVWKKRQVVPRNGLLSSLDDERTTPHQPRPPSSRPHRTPSLARLGDKVPLSPPIQGETPSTLPPHPAAKSRVCLPTTCTLSQPPDPTISPTATPYCVPILHLHRLLGLNNDISDQQSTPSPPLSSLSCAPAFGQNIYRRLSHRRGALFPSPSATATARCKGSDLDIIPSSASCASP